MGNSLTRIAVAGLIAVVSLQSSAPARSNQSASQTPTAARRWYPDRDGDGHGDWYRFLDSPTRPAGFVSNHTDCDDTKALVNEAATDKHNGLDYNCDGLEEVYVTRQPCKPSSSDCDQDSHNARRGGGDDCDDGDRRRYPRNVEVSDGIDNDCDPRTADTGYNRPYSPTRFVALDAPYHVR